MADSTKDFVILITHNLYKCKSKTLTGIDVQ